MGNLGGGSAVTVPRIRRVVVLGANGTMGFGSAAQFTAAGAHVTFLARSRAKAEEGLTAAVKQVRSETVRNRASVGDYESDLDDAVANADLIFEALTEDMEIKRAMFERIDRLRRDDAIVATVTSGLSINALAEGRSESFRRHFLGLHLFNPANVIVGTELIAGDDTDPQITDFVERYATERLGRVIVRTADTAGFAGNRVGFKVLNEAAQLAQEHGPLLVDKLIGPYTGRAMPPLATIDLVGWDIHRAIVDNVADKTKDEAHATLQMPAYMRKLLEQGTLGNKGGKGFFARDGKRSLVLEPDSGRYLPTDEVDLPVLPFVDEICALHRVGDYQSAMRVFADARGEYAEIAQRVVAGYISYGFHRVGEVTQDIAAVDLIMGYGFNWAPPSVLVDTLSPRATVEMMERTGVVVPEALTAALKEGRTEPFFRHPTLNRGKFYVAA